MALGIALSVTPAHAQLGSLANPPPQNLFDFNQPPRLDPGIAYRSGTYAERRARLLHDHNRARHQPARRTPATPQ